MAEDLPKPSNAEMQLVPHTRALCRTPNTSDSAGKLQTLPNTERQLVLYTGPTSDTPGSPRRAEEIQIATNHDKRATLLTMPPEIILMIAGFSNSISATCLGLTCKQLYPSCKPHLSKGMATLLDCSCGGGNHEDARKLHLGIIQPYKCSYSPLYALITSWIGPNYYFESWVPATGGPDEACFFNKIAYPLDDNHRAFRAWVCRYYDHEKSTFFAKTNNISNRAIVPLPSPLGLGEAWDDIAEKVIMADLESGQDVEEWEGRWKTCVIFQEDRIQKLVREFSLKKDCEADRESDGLLDIGSTEWSG